MSRGKPANIHGTYSMYFRGKCRCDECREYQRARVARNRAARKAMGNLTHGTRSAYDAGCRCNACKEKRALIYEVQEKPHEHSAHNLRPYGQCERCDDIHVGIIRVTI